MTTSSWSSTLSIEHLALNIAQTFGSLSLSPPGSFYRSPFIMTHFTDDAIVWVYKRANDRRSRDAQRSERERAKKSKLEINCFGQTMSKLHMKFHFKIFVWVCRRQILNLLFRWWRQIAKFLARCIHVEYKRKVEREREKERGSERKIQSEKRTNFLGTSGKSEFHNSTRNAQGSLLSLTFLITRHFPPFYSLLKFISGKSMFREVITVTCRACSQISM